MVTKFKHALLVISDKQDDKAAIECALELAKRNKASIKVVKVVDNLSKFIEVSRPILQRIVNIKKLITDDLEKKIQHKVKKSKRLSSVTYKILEGTAFIEIIKETLRHKHDLLIISAEGEKSIDVGFFSSTNFYLLRKCPCPVWVVKPAKKINYKNILVTVDIDPEDEVKTDLNNKLMKAALMLADQYDSKLHVFYAWQLYGENTLRNSQFLKIKKSAMDMAVKEEKNSNIKRLNDFVEKFNIENIAIHKQLHKGLPTKLIPDFIKKNHIDLVVMGTVCRIGIPGFIIGNTAEEILRKIRCSVLTIKPDGFVSPVAL